MIQPTLTVFIYKKWYNELALYGWMAEYDANIAEDVTYK